jgi:Protein of unknown function (DUF3300)
MPLDGCGFRASGFDVIPDTSAGNDSSTSAADLRTTTARSTDRADPLYHNPLLSQVLMASTYPLEIVEAAR